MTQERALEKHLDPGLYLIGTPIGNLEDITLRALRVLKQADLIACEDTRQTQKLLNHFTIATKTTSYHQHNEKGRAEELVGELKKGIRIAVVTDAGMPAISDPGFRLVELAIEQGIPVIPVPGPSAFLSALIASGLPSEVFQFNGFLPSKRGARRKAFELIRESQHTQLFYEAPHRIVEALEDVAEVLGAFRPVVIARELTKVYEEFVRGGAKTVLDMLRQRSEIKGEITLLVGKTETHEQPESPVRSSIHQRVLEVSLAEQVDEKSALKKVARERGLSKSEAYREWQRTKPQ